ncbi:MAG: TolC family protein [Treponema sp.]|nr:TolC family protein [Treponema sp.]
MFILCPLAAQPGKISLGFREAGRLSADSSIELKNQQARRAIREGAWALSIRAFFPQLNFSASEDDRLSLIGADSFTKTYTISLEQLLFDGGRTRAARSIERTELALLSEDLKQHESVLIETAVTAYRQILSSRMIAAIRKETLISLKEQYRIMTEELALGLVIPLDLIHAEITLKEAELELDSMIIQLEEQEKQFTELLGLDKMPELLEQVDVYRSPVIPGRETIYRAALDRNPDLIRLVHSIMQKETEVKLASRSLIPLIKATGSYSLSGQRYPLTRQSWNFGLSLNFSSPWFNAGAGGSAGWEPPYDKTARAQSNFSPLPDPASGLSAKQANLALALERENYLRFQERLEREAALGVNVLQLNEQRRILAVESLKLGAERYRLSEVLLSLGRITRIELMEERLKYAQKEAAAVEAATALLEAERSLERLIDLPPGTLEEFNRRNGRFQKQE